MVLKKLYITVLITTRRQFGCNFSTVTLSTHATVTYLAHLPTLVLITIFIHCCWRRLQCWCFWSPVGWALCPWQCMLLGRTSKLPLTSSFILGEQLENSWTRPRPRSLILQWLYGRWTFVLLSPFLWRPFHQAGKNYKLILLLSPRQCNVSILSELVTFHIFFDIDHLPPSIPHFHQVLNVL